ncbi:MULTISPECIES: CU044_2847 family protein [unclassified Streptomyces]|uniref:CU044_2847 family protein n=1 Tax=unclassified Streptomyces TaxID=2593676 RepID=UPI003818EFE5
MTDELLRFPLDGGGEVTVEARADEAGMAGASRGDGAIATGTSTFNRALDGVRDAADAALRSFSTLAQRPDEVQIQFGVRLTAEAGAVITKTGVEGHLQVTVTWSGGRPGPRERERRRRREAEPAADEAAEGDGGGGA